MIHKVVPLFHYGMSQGDLIHDLAGNRNYITYSQVRNFSDDNRKLASPKKSKEIILDFKNKDLDIKNLSKLMQVHEYSLQKAVDALPQEDAWAELNFDDREEDFLTDITYWGEEADRTSDPEKVRKELYLEAIADIFNTYEPKLSLKENFMELFQIAMKFDQHDVARSLVANFKESFLEKGQGLESLRKEDPLMGTTVFQVFRDQFFKSILSIDDYDLTDPQGDGFDLDNAFRKAMTDTFKYGILFGQENPLKFIASFKQDGDSQSGTNLESGNLAYLQSLMQSLNDNTRDKLAKFLEDTGFNFPEIMEVIKKSSS